MDVLLKDAETAQSWRTWLLRPSMMELVCTLREECPSVRLSVRPSLVPLPVFRCCWTVLELQATLWDDPLHIQNKELS